MHSLSGKLATDRKKSPFVKQYDSAGSAWTPSWEKNILLKTKLPQKSEIKEYQKEGEIQFG